MVDAFVDEFHSRDLDAKMLQREVDAVNEWKKTKFTFHIMRDHPYHGFGKLGQGLYLQSILDQQSQEVEESPHEVTDFGAQG